MADGVWFTLNLFTAQTFRADLLMGQKHERCKKHRDCNGRNKGFNRLQRQDPVDFGVLKKDKGKFATLGQGNGKKGTFFLRHFEDETKSPEDKPFKGNKASRQASDQEDLVTDQGEIQAGSNGNKKDTQE